MKNTKVINIDNKKGNVFIDFNSDEAHITGYNYRPPFGYEILVVDNAERVDLNLETSSSINIHFGVGDSVKELNLYIKSFDSLKIEGRSKCKISIFKMEKDNDTYATVNSIIIEDVTLQVLNLNKIKIGSFLAANSIIKNLSCVETDFIHDFSLKYLRLDKSNFDLAYLPRFITIENVDLIRHDGPVNFLRLRNNFSDIDNSSFDKERTMRISNTDLNKFQLNYNEFSFHIDSTQHIEPRLKIYEQILKHLQDDAYTSKYNVYHNDYSELIDNKNHRDITNLINKYWWNKGRNKGKAVMYTCFIFLFFVSLNWALYERIKKVYYPRSFIDYDTDLQNFRNSISGKFPIMMELFYFAKCGVGVLIYTSFIFWGLKLDVNEIKIKSIYILFLILFEYAVGLVCLAYIISFIIIKL